MPAKALKPQQLENLLMGVDFTIYGDIADTGITGLSSDSRKTSPGDLIAAIRPSIEC